MATLSEQERKRIQRYCICPKVAGAALAMAFVLPFLIIPFEMIDDIVFHHESFQETGMMTALALTAVELIIFCYCALAPRFGMRGKQWREMQHRLAVEQSEKDRSAQIAGVVGTQAAARLLKNSDNETARNLGGAAEVAAAVGAVATAADVLAESFANAKAMAEACEKDGIQFYYPSPIFCTDNAAMIGTAAYYEYLKGNISGWDLNAIPNLKLGER